MSKKKLSFLLFSLLVILISFKISSLIQNISIGSYGGIVTAGPHNLYFYEYDKETENNSLYWGSLNPEMVKHKYKWMYCPNATPTEKVRVLWWDNSSWYLHTQVFLKKNGVWYNWNPNVTIILESNWTLLNFKLRIDSSPIPGDFFFYYYFDTW